MNVEGAPGVGLLLIHNLSYVCIETTTSERSQCSSTYVPFFLKVQTSINFLRWPQSKLATHRTFEPTV